MASRCDIARSWASNCARRIEDSYLHPSTELGDRCVFDGDRRENRRMNLERLKYPIVQISLDLTSLDEALDTAAIAVDAGVDWLGNAAAPGGRAACGGTAPRPFSRSADRRRPQDDGRRVRGR